MWVIGESHAGEHVERTRPAVPGGMGAADFAGILARPLEPGNEVGGDAVGGYGKAGRIHRDGGVIAVGGGVAAGLAGVGEPQNGPRLGPLRRKG